MKKTFIIAVTLALSQFAWANEPTKSYEPAKSSEPRCPVGAKLVRGAEITITQDGSGTLVERDSCESLEPTITVKK